MLMGQIGNFWFKGAMQTSERVQTKSIKALKVRMVEFQGKKNGKGNEEKKAEGEIRLFKMRLLLHANCYYMGGSRDLFSGCIQNEGSESEQKWEQLGFKTDVQAKS